jgi:hypothetical protein
MKKSICHLFLATLLCLTGAGRAEAQLGAILDWIHKLSGPGVVQAGLTYAAPLTPLDAEAVPRLRFSLMGGSAIDKSEEVAPPGGSILLVTGQVMIEVDLAGGVVSPGLGVSGHVFFGDVDTFFKPSFPLRVTFRPLKNTLVLKGLLVAPSLHYFPEWGADDFQPLTVQVSRDGGEVTLGLLLGYEFTI